MVFSGSFEKQISQGMFQISQNIQHVFILDFHVRKRGKIQVWKITVKMPTKDFQAISLKIHFEEFAHLNISIILSD